MKYYITIATLAILSSIWINRSLDQTGIEFVELDKNINARVGKNIPISSQFSEMPLVEPTLSAHPADPNILLAAAMVVTDVNRPYESCSLSSFYSSDKGKTWEETVHDFWGYDPWLSILEDGSTSMSWLGTPGKFQHQFPLQIFRSDNCGKDWSSSVESFEGEGHGHDGTKLIGLGGKTFLTTVRFTPSRGADVVLYCANGLEKYQEVALIQGKGRRLNFCEPAILSDGDVIVPTMHGQGKIWTHKYDAKSGKLSEVSVVSDNPKLGRGYSRLAADVGPKSGFKDNLYFVRAVADGNSSKGVWLNISSDKGETWTLEKRIDLFHNNRLSKANVASVAVNNNGVVGISWVDGQHSEDQRAYDVYFSISMDGGKSFQRPLRVTSKSSDPRTKANDDVANKFIGGGHYLGLTAKADGHFQLLWSDSREEIFKLQTCEIQVF